jgi:hypothetical protein
MITFKLSKVSVTAWLEHLTYIRIVSPEDKGTTHWEGMEVSPAEGITDTNSEQGHNSAFLNIAT